MDFYLRKGVRLHNGKRLTVHHVIHSLNRFMKAENNPHAWMLQHVESFRAVDEFVVEIQLHVNRRCFTYAKRRTVFYSKMKQETS